MSLRRNNNNSRLSSEHDQLKKREREALSEEKQLTLKQWTQIDEHWPIMSFCFTRFYSSFILYFCMFHIISAVWSLYADATMNIERERDTEEQKHPVNVLKEFQCHWHRQPSIQILIIKWKHVWHHHYVYTPKHTHFESL